MKEHVVGPLMAKLIAAVSGQAGPAESQTPWNAVAGDRALDMGVTPVLKIRLT